MRRTAKAFVSTRGFATLIGRRSITGSSNRQFIRAGPSTGTTPSTLSFQRVTQAQAKSCLNGRSSRDSSLLLGGCLLARLLGPLDFSMQFACVSRLLLHNEQVLSVLLLNPLSSSFVANLLLLKPVMNLSSQFISDPLLHLRSFVLEVLHSLLFLAAVRKLRSQF